MRKNEVNVITLGCSKNLVDSEQLMRLFSSAGYTVRHDPKRVTGEYVVINTCGFIGSAQEESINMILDFIEAKRSGQIGKVFVMGCLSERFRGDLKSEIPEIDAIYGKFDWKNLIQHLGHSFSIDKESQRIITTPKHYAYLKISEGCNRKCSYCAIPIITGDLKSRSPQSLINEVQNLVQQGCSEFQLIAQDLTSYGWDFDKNNHLAELLARLSDIQGVRRLRLHYAYPKHFPFEILPLIRERDNICNYLDIALQHASDNMLQKMRRGITQQQTEDLIAQIRDEVPQITLRTTLMVGHPGETEEDFEKLIDFTQRMKFERMGAFSYSHEKDTFAEKNYQDEIDAAIKTQRLETLMNVQEPIAEAHSQSFIGSIQEIVIDRREKDYLIGRTQYDSPEVDPEVLIPIEYAKGLKVGHYYNAKIIDTEGFDLIAQVIKKNSN